MNAKLEDVVNDEGTEMCFMWGLLCREPVDASGRAPSVAGKLPVEQTEEPNSESDSESSDSGSSSAGSAFAAISRRNAGKRCVVPASAATDHSGGTVGPRCYIMGTTTSQRRQLVGVQ